MYFAHSKLVTSYEEDRIFEDVSDDFFPLDKDATCRVSSLTFVCEKKKWAKSFNRWIQKMLFKIIFDNSDDDIIVFKFAKKKKGNLMLRVMNINLHFRKH